MDSGIETNDSTSEADKLSKVRLVMLILPFSDFLNIRTPGEGLPYETDGDARRKF